MRYRAADARFAVKEIDVGVTADVGTLRRLPRLIGEGLARELAYTRRTLDAVEAVAMRLVNRAPDSTEALYAGVREIAARLPRSRRSHRTRRLGEEREGIFPRIFPTVRRCLAAYALDSMARQTGKSEHRWVETVALAQLT
jgi:enoyl-CoA hydratase/carnithine racemase